MSCKVLELYHMDACQEVDSTWKTSESWVKHYEIIMFYGQLIKFKYFYRLPINNSWSCGIIGGVYCPCSCSWSSVIRKPRRLIPKNIGATIYRAMMLFFPLHILECMCKIYFPSICRFYFTTPTEGVSKTIFLTGCCLFIPIRAHMTNSMPLTRFGNYLDIQSIKKIMVFRLSSLVEHEVCTNNARLKTTRNCATSYRSTKWFQKFNMVFFIEWNVMQYSATCNSKDFVI